MGLLKELLRELENSKPTNVAESLSNKKNTWLDNLMTDLIDQNRGSENWEDQILNAMSDADEKASPTVIAKLLVKHHVFKDFDKAMHYVAKFKKLTEAKKVDKLDPETEKQLEDALVKIAATKDLDKAKKIALDFLDSMKFQEKAAKYKNLVNKATNVQNVVKFVYDVKLAGEGLGVIK